MADINLPYVIWRDGRPRFHPSAAVHRLGFPGRDLKHPDGRWYTLDEARAFALARHAEITAARARGQRRKEPRAAGHTVEHLLADWLAAITAETDPSLALKPKTIAGYRKSAAAVLYAPETRADAMTRRARTRTALVLGQAPPARAREPLADTPVSAIGKVELHNFFLHLKKHRGLHMAHAAIAAFSAAYTWGGTDPRWRLGRNPRHEMELPRPKGRIVVFSDHEIMALLAAADALDRASVGDAIMLGLMTAQRQGDRLALIDEGIVDGRRQIRQGKTGLLVAVKETPQLSLRLDDARRRRAALSLKRGQRPEERRREIVIDEHAGRAFEERTYRRAFAAVRARAVAGDAARGVAPCPSVAGKRDQDLRDTAVTWLARSGCTLVEICAISGHSPKSVQVIVAHYLGSTRELADTGIDKLVSWMAREGIMREGPTG